MYFKKRNSMNKIAVINKNREIIFYESSSVALKRNEDNTEWVLNAQISESDPMIVSYESDQIEELGFKNKELRLKGHVIDYTEIKRSDYIRLVILDEEKGLMSEFTYFAKNDKDISVIDEDFIETSTIYLLHRNVETL